MDKYKVTKGEKW